MLDRGKFLSARVIERVLNEEGSIDPKITAPAILHPRQHALNKIEKLGQMKWVCGRFHYADIKRHYYITHDINPTRIVPLGPVLDLQRPHGRGI